MSFQTHKFIFSYKNTFCAQKKKKVFIQQFVSFASP